MMAFYGASLPDSWIQCSRLAAAPRGGCGTARSGGHDPEAHDALNMNTCFFSKTVRSVRTQKADNTNFNLITKGCVFKCGYNAHYGIRMTGQGLRLYVLQLIPTALVPHIHTHRVTQGKHIFLFS